MTARNLVLTGFMGTGKSTVGRVVAERLEMPFVDMDGEIETRTGLTIPQIFAEQGEAAFRRIESDVCAELAACGGLVIATGGGALINPENVRTMQGSGLVICLDADPDTIRQRLADEAEGRPLAAQWEALYERRRPAYAALPHHIDTRGKTPETIAQGVITLWQKTSE
jgi:shikimate kinase